MRLRLSGNTQRALRGALLGLLSIAGGTGASRADDTSQSVFGLWKIEDGTAIVSIARCDDGLCGAIVGMSDPVDKSGHVAVDHRGTPLCGLTILHAKQPASGYVWQGHIINPNDGSDWTCEVWSDADGLHLRGYVLVPLLGQTQTWRKYRGNVTPDCHISS
jgi:uncharacterized protein (DUF2147 family)